MTGTTLRNIAQLQDAGLVASDRTAALERVAARYAVAITPAMAALIDRTDPNDPIGRQFIPDPAELLARPQERVDPIGDACKPGREHVQEGRDAREQKYGRERHLNDVGDRIESRSGIVDAEHRWRYAVTALPATRHPRTRRMKLQ